MHTKFIKVTDFALFFEFNVWGAFFKEAVSLKMSMKKKVF